MCDLERGFLVVGGVIVGGLNEEVGDILNDEAWSRDIFYIVEDVENDGDGSIE